MSNEIDDFIHGLYSVEPRHKLAQRELEHLSIAELEVILGIDPEMDKEACGIATAGETSDFLSQFEGTPLLGKAIALEEERLKADMEDIRRREERDAAYRDDNSVWTARDKLRLKQQALRLELAKHKAGAGSQAQDETPPKTASTESDATKNTGNAHYTASPGSQPAWPAEASGQESAGRPATAAESKGQQDTATPQHVAPKTAGLLTAVEKRAFRLPSAVQAENAANTALKGFKSVMKPVAKLTAKTKLKGG